MIMSASGPGNALQLTNDIHIDVFLAHDLEFGLALGLRSIRTIRACHVLNYKEYSLLIDCLGNSSHPYGRVMISERRKHLHGSNGDKLNVGFRIFYSMS